MPTLKEVLTTDENKHIRKLQLELLSAATMGEASKIRIEIDSYLTKVRNRYFQQCTDEQASKKKTQTVTPILPFKLR